MFLNDNSEDNLSSFDIVYYRVFQVRKEFIEVKWKTCVAIDTQFVFCINETFHYDMESLVTFKFILKSDKHNNEFYKYMVKMDKKWWDAQLYATKEQLSFPFTNKYYSTWFHDLVSLKKRRKSIFKCINYKHLLDELPSVYGFIWDDSTGPGADDRPYRDFSKENPLDNRLSKIGIDSLLTKKNEYRSQKLGAIGLRLC